MIAFKAYAVLVFNKIPQSDEDEILLKQSVAMLKRLK